MSATGIKSVSESEGLRIPNRKVRLLNLSRSMGLMGSHNNQFENQDQSENENAKGRYYLKTCRIIHSYQFPYLLSVFYEAMGATFYISLVLFLLIDMNVFLHNLIVLRQLFGIFCEFCVLFHV